MAVPALEVEADGEAASGCDCCDGQSHTAWGFVHVVDGGTLAAYYLGWVEGGAHAEAWLAISLGPWGSDSDDPADRVNVPVVVSREHDAVQMGLHDHGLFDHPDPLGRRLAREEALDHPDVDLVWAIADAIWVGDPRVPAAEALL